MVIHRNTGYMVLVRLEPLSGNDIVKPAVLQLLSRHESETAQAMFLAPQRLPQRRKDRSMGLTADLLLVPTVQSTSGTCVCIYRVVLEP